MYNFGNLSDVEFEELCKDIMSARLPNLLVQRLMTAAESADLEILESSGLMRGVSCPVLAAEQC